MDTETIVWVVGIVVGIVLLLGLAAWARKRGSAHRDERNRLKADALRQDAASRETTVQRQQAQADELRAEADRKAAEAERLDALAKERGKKAADHRARHDEVLRKADELDPDVDTDAGTSRHRRTG